MAVHNIMIVALDSKTHLDSSAIEAPIKSINDHNDYDHMWCDDERKGPASNSMRFRQECDGRGRLLGDVLRDIACMGHGLPTEEDDEIVSSRWERERMPCAPPPLSMIDIVLLEQLEREQRMAEEEEALAQAAAAAAQASVHRVLPVQRHVDGQHDQALYVAAVSRTHV